jgi:hypothetical protein
VIFSSPKSPHSKYEARARKNQARPTPLKSYNAGVVNVYNASSSLVRFEIKNIFSSTLKNALAYYIQPWLCSCKVVGFAPVSIPKNYVKVFILSL